MEDLQEKTFEILEKSKLNWTVEKKPLSGPDGEKTESFGIFKTDGKWLGTVGNIYVPFQNFELVETLLQASTVIDSPVSRGGNIKDGKKVFFQIELDQEFIGNSGVKRYITIMNSHNGTSSIGFGSTQEVLLCGNNFTRIFKETQKFRHTYTAKQRIEAAIEDLKATAIIEKKLMDDFKRMADMPVSDEAIERVITSVFGVNPNELTSDISTKKINQITKLANSIEKEFQLEGATIWGLFNGVTRYTNHIINHKNEDHKVNSLMTGSGYKISNLAFDDLMDFVTKNTAELVFAV